jgi:multidrug efflux pump subunit AcrB
MSRSESGVRRIIAGGVRNPVFVNLLMVCILAGGYFSARGMVRESYPEFSDDHIAVEVIWPGASPEDVERAICTPIEEALRGLEGVRKISSSANENFGTVWIGLLSRVRDRDAILQDIKDRVGQITDWPSDAEEPIVREMVVRREVVNVAIHGDVAERILKQMAREVENDLTAYPEISQVVLSGVRDDEILIEVSEEALRAYNLSLEQIMAVVARSSLDLPAGVIRTAEEEVTLRVTGQRYHAADYEQLVVIEQDGAAVRLGEIARVREGFEDAIIQGRFNGERAVVVQVFKTPDQDSSRIAAIVRDYVEARQGGLPERVGMSVWGDTSFDIDSRIMMLLTNAVAGIALVFLTLWLFLELRIAAWVIVGIPISFGGALIAMYLFGQTLNLISLFGLIIVSGIIVDDAIVIADAVYRRRQEGRSPELASIEGATAMSLPVLGASITTITAFMPLLFVVGVMGKFIYVLPVVVIAAIAMSAIEAFVVLPSHLCHREPLGVPVRERRPTRVRVAIQAAIEKVITQWYRPLYRLALNYRAVTISLAVGGMIVVAGMVAGGRTPVVVFPKEDGNLLRARIRFPQGTPASVAEETIRRLEEAAWALNDDPELRPARPGSLVRQVYSIAGEFAGYLALRGSHLCETQIELMPAEYRRIRDDQIMERWRALVGPIHSASEFRIDRQNIGPVEQPIEIRLLGYDLEQMGEVSEAVQARLREFAGVTNVTDDLVPGKRELRVSLRPSARTLGLTLEDVAKQLRIGFHGGEAVRLYRDRDQVKVRVRLPEEGRRSISDVEYLRINTPLGHEVPFLEVADVSWGRGYNYIMHQDGKRRVRVLADADDRRANTEQIINVLQAGVLDEIVQTYPGVMWEFGGDRERLQESLSSLYRGFDLAIIAIYTILAAMLRSYIQPIVIMLAVPFGLIGAVVGHAVMGLDLTLMSLFGIVALSGVVVNDSLVLLDAINAGVREGKTVLEAVRTAGEARFRAVWLTSITTIAGLGPLIFERSSQAQPVIPMAVSLSFGLMFATVLTLFVVPSLYLVVNDARRFVHWLRYGGAYPAPEIVEEGAHDRWLAVE